MSLPFPYPPCKSFHGSQFKNPGSRANRDSYSEVYNLQINNRLVEIGQPTMGGREIESKALR